MSDKKKLLAVSRQLLALVNDWAKPEANSQ
jgi:hypothetical protein